MKKNSKSRPGRKATTRRKATATQEWQTHDIKLRYPNGETEWCCAQRLVEPYVEESDLYRGVRDAYRLLGQHSDLLKEVTFRFPETK
jgi:hypothetical protein